MSWAGCECGLVFASDWAFDKHFIKKKPATDPRDVYDLICRTDEDLKTEGWGQNDKGWWRTPAPQEGSFRERRTPSESTQSASKGIGTGEN